MEGAAVFLRGNGMYHDCNGAALEKVPVREEVAEEPFALIGCYFVV